MQLGKIDNNHLLCLYVNTSHNGYTMQHTSLSVDIIIVQCTQHKHNTTIGNFHMRGRYFLGARMVSEWAKVNHIDPKMKKTNKTKQIGSKYLFREQRCIRRLIKKHSYNKKTQPNFAQIDNPDNESTAPASQCLSVATRKLMFSM